MLRRILKGFDLPGGVWAGIWTFTFLLLAIYCVVRQKELSPSVVTAYSVVIGMYGTTRTVRKLYGRGMDEQAQSYDVAIGGAGLDYARGDGEPAAGPDEPEGVTEATDRDYAEFWEGRDAAHWDAIRRRAQGGQPDNGAPKRRRRPSKD